MCVKLSLGNLLFLKLQLQDSNGQQFKTVKTFV